LTCLNKKILLLIKKDFTVSTKKFKNVSYVQVDISDTHSIKKAKNKILEVTDHLDLLINSAGIFLDHHSLPSEVKLETLRQEFDVNFFGTFQMIQTFLPLVKKSSDGKIVNVTTDMSSQTMSTMVKQLQSSIRLQFIKNRCELFNLSLR
jgi:NAD(P)-dependent dehydrogenase (short-subunit alcohol dehydrogenase family)